jgi:class 3 adenylate cyclase
LMVIAARVMGEAGSGEVLISRAVRNLLSGQISSWRTVACLC